MTSDDREAYIPLASYSMTIPASELAGSTIAIPRDQYTERYKRFMPIALAVAQMSKDASSKVGAVILGPDREIRSTGWNGAPRGSRADEDPERMERPEKYQWVSHAEMNAIAQAAKVGTPLNTCVMVVTHPPCMICARLIVQAGITMVVYRKPSEEFAARWAEDMTRARRLFAECGVRVVETEDEGN